MFLFKLTFPLLGTATFGAVGTGIYYGVETWKENVGQKTKPIEAKPLSTGKNRDVNQTKTHEAGPSPEKSQTLPPSPDSPPQPKSSPEPQPPSLPSVEVVIEQDEDQK